MSSARGKAPDVSDDVLLDFDTGRLATYKAASAAKALAEQPDAYRSQLVAAHWIDSWREGLERRPPHEESDDWVEGAAFAMREIAAHLRQGDLLPGGVLYTDTVRVLEQRS